MWLDIYMGGKQTVSIENITESVKTEGGSLSTYNIISQIS